MYKNNESLACSSIFFSRFPAMREIILDAIDVCLFL